MAVWIMSLLGLIVIGASLTSFSSRLKPIQGAGIALGVAIMLFPWLPPGRYSLYGTSYEKAEEAKASAQVVSTTNEQLNAFVRRIATLERRVSLLEAPATTPADRRSAQAADIRARRNYAMIAQRAAAARRRYVEWLSLSGATLIPTPPCCEDSGNDQGSNVAGSAQNGVPAPTQDNPFTPPCCTAVTEPTILDH